MGQRSRKRARRDRPPAASAPAARRPQPTVAPPTASPPAAATGASRVSRSEARNAERRAQLDPLHPGERPRAVTVSAVIATVLTVGNIGLYAAGIQIRGQPPTFLGIAGVSAVLALCSFGLWRARYWGVLGFQTMLALTLVIAGLSLPLARGLRGVVICLAILGPGGYLFYKLVRSMARIQMPERRPRS